MENAKAYEYLFEQQQHHHGHTNCVPTNAGHTANTNPPVGNVSAHSNQDPSSSSWWMSLVSKLEHSYQSEQHALTDRLHQAKRQTKSYKAELRDNLQSRLAYLEAQVQQAAPETLNEYPGLSRVSTLTTHATQSSESDDDHLLNPVPWSADPDADDNAYEQADAEHPSPQQLRNAYAQRLHETEYQLERVVSAHEKERGEWAQALDHAAAATADGQVLSTSMQAQLETLSAQVEQSHRAQKAQWQERTRVLTQLLELTETQHAQERIQWQRSVQHATDAEQEAQDLREQLAAADDQRMQDSAETEALRSALAAAESERTRAQMELETARTTAEQELVAAREQIRISQRQVARLQENLRTASPVLAIPRPSPSTPSTPTRSLSFSRQDPDADSPRRRVEWDDKLDRAMAERDVAQQELQTLRRQWNRHLEDGASRDAVAHRQAVAALREEHEIATERLRDDHQAELERIRHEARAEADRIADAKVDALATRHRHELETARRQRTEVVTHDARGSSSNPSDDVSPVVQPELARNGQPVVSEKRYRDLVEKRNELVSRIRKMEEQHANDKGSWKLQLEGALANGRRLEEEKQTALEDLESLRAEYRTSQQSLETLRQQAEREDGTARMDELRQSFQSDLPIWKTRCADLESEKEEILAAAEIENAQQLKAMDQQLAEAKSIHGRKFTELETGHADAIESWKIRVAELNADHRVALETLRSTHADAREGWQIRLADLEKECRELRAVRDSFLKEIQEWNNRVETVRQESRQDLETLAESRCREVTEWKDCVQDRDRRIVLLEKSHAEDLREWKDRLDATLEANSEQLEALRGSHDAEMTELQEELQSARKEVEELEARYEEQLVQKTDELHVSRSETEGVLDRSNDLMESLEELRESHRIAKEEWETKLRDAIQDRDAYIKELEANREHTGNGGWQDYASHLQTNQAVICKAVDEVRKDVVAVRETLQDSAKTTSVIENANYVELREDLEHIQISLNGAVADLTLETEAMMESRKDINSLIHNTTRGPDAGLVDKQDKLMSEIGDLRESFQKYMKLTCPPDVAIQDTIRLEMVAELQRKENMFLQVKTEVEHLTERLASEQGVRQDAEKEVAKLNDQVDAYSEELMHLQAVNAGLEETLREAEQRIEDAMKIGHFVDPGEMDPENDTDSSKFYGYTSPLLEEALALAEGLTDIVHGRGDYKKESSVMDMLESISELIDEHEKRSPVKAAVPENEATENAVSHSSLHHFSRIEELAKGNVANVLGDRLNAVDDQHEPEPVTSPHQSPDVTSMAMEDFSSSTLSLVVDQLYSRCQLLERERTELMEVSLDLLQSAKQANAAELDAALATAQRHAAEEVIKMRAQNQQDQWRLYHKLCGKCQHGVLRDVKGEERKAPSL
jgi:hypothetical protein